MRLTVKPLTNMCPGGGMAVIDRTVLQDIGVSSGEFVELRIDRFEQALDEVGDDDSPTAQDAPLA